MNRCILLALIGLIYLAGQVSAQASEISYTLSDAVRLPAESFVGDPVELRYTIRSAYRPPEPFAEVQPFGDAQSSTVADPQWGTVESLRMNPHSDGFELRLVVIPYEAGTLTLPPIVIGEIRLEGLSLVVSSVLGNDESLRPVHGPQYLPRTRSLVVVFFLALILVPVAAIYLLGPGRRHIAMLRSAFHSRAPHRQLVRRLDELHGSLEDLSGKEFYIELVLSLQLFMGARLGTSCISQTSTELTGQLSDLARSSGSTPDATIPLVEVFGIADAVKFANKRVRRTLRAEHINRVRGVAEALEEARRRNRRRSQRRALWLRRNRAPEASSVGV